MQINFIEEIFVIYWEVGGWKEMEGKSAVWEKDAAYGNIGMDKSFIRNYSVGFV